MISSFPHFYRFYFCSVFDYFPKEKHGRAQLLFLFFSCEFLHIYVVWLSVIAGEMAIKKSYCKYDIHFVVGFQSVFGCCKNMEKYMGRFAHAKAAASRRSLFSPLTLRAPEGTGREKESACHSCRCTQAEPCPVEWHCCLILMSSRSRVRSLGR